MLCKQKRMKKKTATKNQIKVNAGMKLREY